MGIFNKKQTIAPTNVIDKSRLLTADSPFMVKETYKTLRTNIMFALPNENETGVGQVVLFTSAIPGEGKTTVCVNTAITFAQTGAKVLLIESDLRVPKLHKYFGIDGKIGFSDALGKFCDVNKAIVTIKEYNLDCIPGGQIPPNPAELLGSKTTSVILDELKKSYDYIFIDTPPIGVVTDALAVAPIVSGVVIIAREGYTPKTALKDMVQSLKFANAKVLGIIDNCANQNESFYMKSGSPFRYLNNYPYKNYYKYQNEYNK